MCSSVSSLSTHTQTHTSTHTHTLFLFKHPLTFSHSFSVCGSFTRFHSSVTHPPTVVT